MSRTTPLILLFLFAVCSPAPVQSENKVVIAEKSSYNLSGNSLPGIAAAIAEGAEVLRLVAVMTADQKVILLDDATLGEKTGVQELFPDRAAADGLYYPIDFSYQEIQQLPPGNEPLPGQSDFPENSPSFLQIPLLSEALELIKTMTAGTGRRPEIVLELKQNWRYLHQQMDLSYRALSLMAQHGFNGENDGFVATHDPEELKRIHDEIMPALGLSLKTLQLVDTGNNGETMRFERDEWLPYNYDWLFTKFGLKSLSSFSDAIGFPPQTAISPEGQILLAEYFEDAHLLGMQLFAIPFDQFAAPLPPFSATFADLAAFCLFEVGFDGLSTQKYLLLKDFLAQRLVEIKKQAEHPKTPIEILLERAKMENVSQ